MKVFPGKFTRHKSHNSQASRPESQSAIYIYIYETVRLIGVSRNWARKIQTREPSRAEPSRDDPSRAGPSRAEPSRAETSGAEPSRAEPSQAEPCRAEPSRAGRAEPSQAKPSRAEPSTFNFSFTGYMQKHQFLQRILQEGVHGINAKNSK